MANNFKVHIDAWVNNERPIVSLVVLVPQARLAVGGCAGLESCGVELSDLLGVCE